MSGKGEEVDGGKGSGQLNIAKMFLFFFNQAVLTSQLSLLDKVPRARLLSRPSVILRHLEQLSSVNLGIRGRETAATDDHQLSAAIGQLSLEELQLGEESVTPALDLRHIALTGRRDNFFHHFSPPTTYVISSRSPTEEESSFPGPR